MSFRWSGSLINKRIHNSICKSCKKSIYRRPKEIENAPVYVCIKCRSRKEKCCLNCKKKFIYKNRKSQKYCSTQCGNTSRRGMNYEKNKLHNKTKQRKSVLIEAFGINNCMVEGCNYSRTLDIHRYIPGRKGGKYEIGNMFFVCPNHHAEETRKLVKLIKINNYTLRAEYDN